MARARDPVFDSWVEAARAMPVEDLARARGLKLRRESAVERSGPCPDCGGEDRFSVNVRRNLFNCRKCGHKGDPVDFVQWLDRCDFLRACETLTGIAPPRGEGSGLDREALARLEQERRERRAKQEAEAQQFRERERRTAHQIWRAGMPARGSLVEAYLELRGLSLPRRHTLKYAPAAKLFVLRRGAPPELIHTGPAMLGGIIGPDGRFGAVHQTWLDLAQKDGKAVIFDPTTGEILPSKKVRGSKSDGRIEVARSAHEGPADEPRRLVLGEGIETVLSVREALLHVGDRLEDCAFWSSVDLGNMAGPATHTIKHPTDKHANGHRVTLPGPDPAPRGGIPIPDSVVELILLGDGDSEPFLTRTTIERASRRYARPGRVIRSPFAPAGLDFNSYLRGQ